MHFERWPGSDMAEEIGTYDIVATHRASKIEYSIKKLSSKPG